MKLKRVLVVDDDALTRRLVARTLERAGIEVSTAAGGLEALEMLADEVPDLVLLDWSMPDIDGVEVIRRARARAELVAVPFVLLTGHADDETTRRRAEEAGVAAVLGKPFSARELAGTLEAAAERAAGELDAHRAEKGTSAPEQP